MLLKRVERSLYKMIKKGPMEVKKYKRIAKMITLAIQHFHRHHILHGDIKPENVLMFTDDVAKLADLGEVRVVEEGKPCTGAIGSPRYRAPEMGTPAGFGLLADI
ncbi:hypothetical protein BGX23_006087 [Mortierella sp. AD031]|nr:hypothetical protein BGX23_006087 [Mortierella sp. AD031]KAG0219485.1 hypothetical protein BGX33_002755 [Mortierella sp. NVP41]